MTARRRTAAYLLIAALAGAGMAAGAAGSATAQASAAKAKPKPKLKQVFPYWEHFVRIPAAERSRFQLTYYLLRNDKPITNQALFAVDGARREPIALGPDGRARPPALDFFRSKTAYIDAPGASGQDFSVNMQLQSTAQLAGELDAAEMNAALTQANAGIRKAAGVIGMVAPKMGRTIFVDSQGGEAVGANGRRTRLPLIGNSAYYQPATMPGVQRLILTKTPTRITLAPAAKSKG